MSSLEHHQIQCIAYKALADEYDSILKAAMQSTPLDAGLVWTKLAKIEMMYDPAAQIGSLTAASGPSADSSSAPA